MPLPRSSREIASGVFCGKRSQFHLIRPFFNKLAGPADTAPRVRIPQSQPSGSDRLHEVGLTGFNPYATVGVTRSSQFSVSL